MGWFLISNHCVVGATVAAKTQSAMTQMPCHGNQPAPAKQTGDENMPCCKVLKALEAKTLSVAPATFDFVVNLKSAKALRLALPHSLLAAAEQI